MLVLSGVCVLCFAGYGISVAMQKDTSQEEEKSEKLFEVSADDIMQITYNWQEEEIALEKDGKDWQYKEDAAFSLNQTMAETMSEALSGAEVLQKIEEKDKKQLFNLIDVVLKGLPDPAHFIPYEQWELDSMFDDVNYAPLYGAYDGEKLVGMAQLYISQEMLADFKDEFGLTNFKVCELGGNLVLPEYRGYGITTKLQTMELQLAKDLGFDYIISMAHPNNIGSCKTLEKVGLKFVKETTLSNGFLRKLYMLKLK